MKLSPIADLQINAFTGAVITEKESGMVNAIAQTRGNVPYITQRPSIDVFEDASAQSAGSRGRAIYYWNDGSALYICNDDNIYKGSQDTSISSAVTTGTKKCKFVEVGTLLVLVNPES